MFKNKILQTLAMTLISTQTAFAAANANWAKPGVDLFSSVEMGITDIAVTLLGLGVMIYAVQGVVRQKLEMQTAIIIVICGLLITVGPGMIRTMHGV